MANYLSTRKKTQRRINSYVRKANKLIENDNLWRGRFVIRQKRAIWQTFEDDSASYLCVLLICVDKKTSDAVYKWFDSSEIFMWNGGEILRWLNDCIVKDFDVWSDREFLKNDKTDYTQIKFDF